MPNSTISCHGSTHFPQLDAQLQFRRPKKFQLILTCSRKCTQLKPNVDQRSSNCQLIKYTLAVICQSSFSWFYMYKMTGHAGTHVYLFGFNGFQQIDKSKGDVSVSLPQKSVLDCGTVAAKCVFTWSQVWTVTGCAEAEIGGFRGEETRKVLTKDNITLKTIIPYGHCSLLQAKEKDNLNVHVLHDSGTLTDVKCDTKNIELLDATGNKVFAVKNGDLYSGNIVISEEITELKLLSLEMKIKVAMVSCGYDHTLVLSKDGEVYSCGSSSRGQLGLGDSSVDIVHTPTAVKTLEGIRLITIAAGGWHSTAVSEFGDLYVWGWNESGQLGLPNGNTKSVIEDTRVMLSTEALNTASSEDGSSKHFSDKEQITGLHTADPGLEVGVPLSVVQNTDPVLVQTVPYGLDIPDEVCVKDVACGSRHTCVLLDSGHLMTTGWNKYGQLGHGDSQTIDFLRTVLYFVQGKETITDIFAGFWNTGIITKPVR